MARTAFTLKGVEFANRVLVASGTFGYGDECANLTHVGSLGGIVTKSLSLKPRPGNPPPRIVETPSGMLNSIGLANIGVHQFIAEKLPVVRRLGTRVVANIAASSIEEYCAVLELLDRQDGVDGYEINVSCPNVKEGGLTFGTSCPKVEEITARLRPLTTKPLIIKLTPNVAQISEFARAAERGGADAVSVINTLIGMAIDLSTRRPKLATTTGGLSGPAIKPVALAKVYEASRAVKIPVIGIGGIVNATDALEFLVAGASMVQVGTASFIDAGTGADVAAGMAAWADRNGVADLQELVGSLKTDANVSVVDSWR